MQFCWLWVEFQQTIGHYFPQTGHNVIGEFWAFYQSVPDAAVIFGMPITEQFSTGDGSGLTVQYFEKARFELHPDQPVGQRVTLTALGSKLYKAGAPTINLTTPGACRTLNGYGVCYDFLTFFDQHGGVARFGNISNGRVLSGIPSWLLDKMYCWQIVAGSTPTVMKIRPG